MVYPAIHRTLKSNHWQMVRTCLVAENIVNLAEIFVQVGIPATRAFLATFLAHCVIKVDENEALPELDNLERNKEGDRYQVRV